MTKTKPQRRAQGLKKRNDQTNGDALITEQQKKVSKNRFACTLESVVKLSEMEQHGKTTKQGEMFLS